MNKVSHCCGAKILNDDINGPACNNCGCACDEISTEKWEAGANERIKYAKSQIKGLQDLCSKVQKVEEALKDYRKRHLRLLVDFQNKMKVGIIHDPMEDYPGLLTKQVIMEYELKELGFKKIKPDCKQVKETKNKMGVEVDDNDEHEDSDEE